MPPSYCCLGSSRVSNMPRWFLLGALPLFLFQCCSQILPWQAPYYSGLVQAPSSQESSLTSQFKLVPPPLPRWVFLLHCFFSAETVPNLKLCSLPSPLEYTLSWRQEPQHSFSITSPRLEQQAFGKYLLNKWMKICLPPVNVGKQELQFQNYNFSISLTS